MPNKKDTCKGCLTSRCTNPARNIGDGTRCNYYTDSSCYLPERILVHNKETDKLEWVNAL